MTAFTLAHEWAAWLYLAVMILLLILYAFISVAIRFLVAVFIDGVFLGGIIIVTMWVLRKMRVIA